MAATASDQRFVVWRGQIVGEENGKREELYFLKEKSGGWVRAVVGTNTTGRMVYKVAEDLFRLTNTNCFYFSHTAWLFKSDVVQWLNSMVSLPYPTTIPHTLHVSVPVTDKTPSNVEVGSKLPNIEDNGKPCTSKKRSGEVPNDCDLFSESESSESADSSGSDERLKDCRRAYNYYGKDYAPGTKRTCTSNVGANLFPFRRDDKKQRTHSIQTGNDGEKSIPAMAFDKERCQRAVTRFVVKDGHAFSVVEGEGFRELIQELQPAFGVPSRMTVAGDIYKLFSDESIKLKKELTKARPRVCLKVDCWTFSTQIAYMCLSAHYIDSDWYLQKKILNVCQISDHKGDTIGKVIEACLLSWGIEKVLSITVDNTLGNHIAVGFVKRRINAWNGSILDGEFMHLNCGAHMVNVIVKEGLQYMHDSIAAIRNCVRYVRSSPVGLQRFKTCVEKEKIDYKGWLVLDTPMRWDSTFMMLDVALKFEKAFVRLVEEDDMFLRYLEETENGKKRVGPPSSNDWECASVFVKFLSTFRDVTIKCSGSLHVTSNNFYPEICDIHGQLSDLAARNDPLLSIMATSVKKKWDEYWGNPNTINPLLFLAVLLDPRYKMRYLKYCFGTIYDPETVTKIVAKVERILRRLYKEYDNKGDRGGDNLFVFSFASESVFSTSGHILDSFRSSLSPKMVEALVCTRDWLEGSRKGILTKEYLDEIQSYVFLEEENMNELNFKATTGGKTKTVIVD